MNKTKNIVGIVVCAVIASSVLYGTTQMNGEGEVRAHLIIEDGSITECEMDLSEGSTVFDLMTACNIPFQEEGGFVTAINNVSQDTDAGTYWMYYINGELGQVGAGEYRVQDGDEITWKLEKF